MKTAFSEFTEFTDALNDAADSDQAKREQARAGAERKAANVFKLRQQVRSLSAANDELRAELDDAREQHEEDARKIEAMQEQIEDLRAKIHG